MRLRVEAVPRAGFETLRVGAVASVALDEHEGRLVASVVPANGRLTARLGERAGERVALLDQSLALFIPEHVADPSLRPPGEELWVEVTIPRAGAPRLIRFGVKKDGQLVPLAVR